MPTLILAPKHTLDIPLRIETIERAGSLVLVLEGELEITTAPLLDEALERARETDAATIVVDLNAISFIDSTGLHVLIKHACTQESCPRITLTKGSPQAQRLFELSGALEYLPLSQSDLRRRRHLTRRRPEYERPQISRGPRFPADS